jgi:ankyrin repeat protein
MRSSFLQVCRYLIKAAKSGNVNPAKILVKCTNDTCADNDKHRSTPLIYASKKGHVDVVRVLLEGGAILDKADSIRSTALHYAASYGHLDVCTLLLDRNATVDPVNWWKDTPLHCAARNGHLSVVMLLVEKGADVRLKNEDAQTARDVASILGNKAVAEWFDSV